MKYQITPLFVLLALVLACGQAPPAPPPPDPPSPGPSPQPNPEIWAVTVVRVIDGDTFTAKRKMVLIPSRFRLAAVDAPELTQPHGLAASFYLDRLIGEHEVQVQQAAKGPFGRMIVWVTVDSKQVQEVMVEIGYAWVDPRFSDDEVLLQLQAEAKKAKRGLWADPNPVPPWEFRRK